MSEEQAKCGPQPLTTRTKQKKFTLERLQQIINLVERGKSRDEIADILGVTVGSLQVTCSRLGISLRRPKIYKGICLLPRSKPPGENARLIHLSDHDGRVPLQPKDEQAQEDSETAEPVLIVKPQQERANRSEAWSASVAIKLQYRGMKRTSELPLAVRTIGILALEAALRRVEIGELILELITAIANKDLFLLAIDNIDPATDRIAADELS
jgi:hypothetical protein